MFFISKRKFEERVWKEVDNLQQKEWADRRHLELAKRVYKLEERLNRIEGIQNQSDVTMPIMG